MNQPILIRSLNNLKWEHGKYELIERNVQSLKVSENGIWTFYVEENFGVYYACTYKNGILVDKFII